MKTMNKHTPGPWKTETIGGTIRVVDQEGNDCGYIGDGYNATHRANIALMAAAPELLEALRGARALLQAQGITEADRIGGEQLTAINRAINKAERGTA